MGNDHEYRQYTRKLTRACLQEKSTAWIEDSVGPKELIKVEPRLVWIEVRGISDFSRDMQLGYCTDLMERLLNGIAHAMVGAHDASGNMLAVNEQLGVPLLAMRIRGDGERIYLRFGCSGDVIHVLEANLRALYPGIHLLRECPSYTRSDFCGGVLTGYPSLNPEEKGNFCELPIDQFLRGVGKAPFCFTVLAKLLEPGFAANIQNYVQEQLQRAGSDAEINFSDADGISRKIQCRAAGKCIEELTKIDDMLNHARMSAFWEVEVFYSAPDPLNADNLGGLLCATMNGKSGEMPEPVNCRRLCYRNQALNEWYSLITTGQVFLNGWDNAFPMNRNPLSTLMSSRELARLLALPREEYAGCYVDQYVPFDVDNRPGRRDGGDFRLGRIVRSCQEDAPTEGIYSLASDDLTRHALIIGLTGGGKTNTSKGLLKQLWLDRKIPFLVIESAKREYWEMCRLDTGEGGQAFPEGSLNVFTLGDENPETASPFRINPMECEAGVSLQTHIDYLLSTFKAAFDLFPPLPFVLERSVYKVYEDRGWDIVTGRNRFNLDRYPMLEDLLEAVIEVTDSLNYHSEVASNVKAALTARVSSLMVGGKRFLMNTPRSVPMEYLLGKPTVLELEDLGDDDTKAFVMGILLVRIYEYRKAMQYRTENRLAGGKKLQHVIMVEEAHRLLKNVPCGGEGNQTRAAAVEFFCNMLAEIRSFGQGFIIADQVPTKLAPDTLKNTNLKIVHRTVMQEDREAVGKAMNMREDQTSYLSALRVGCAAVFGEGDNRPKLVRFPRQDNSIEVRREACIAGCRKRIAVECRDVFERMGNTPACRWCPSPCTFAEEADKSLGKRCGDLLQQLEMFGTEDNAETWIGLMDFYFPNATLPLRICIMGKLLSGSMMNKNKEKMSGLLRDYIAKAAEEQGKQI